MTTVAKELQVRCLSCDEGPRVLYLRIEPVQAPPEVRALWRDAREPEEQFSDALSSALLPSRVSASNGLFTARDACREI